MRREPGTEPGKEPAGTEGGEPRTEPQPGTEPQRTGGRVPAREPSADDRALIRARRLATLLDAAVRIPGTRIRVGLDPLLGLVPGGGDVAGALLAGGVVLAAARLGAPASVLARMLGNLAVDALLGTVPLAGDLFDVAWKANLRNVHLLEEHLSDPAGARRGSRRVVLVAGLAVGLVALLVVAAVIGAARLLAGLLGA